MVLAHFGELNLRWVVERSTALFLDQFYEIFLASSNKVSAMFTDTDTDRGTQKAMLMTLLVYMSNAHNDSPDLLASIAEKHNKLT